MRLQKEEKIALVLLLMALSSLAVADWILGESPGQKSSGITLEGKVLRVRETATGENLMISLDSSPLTVFVPKSAGAADVKLRVRQGDRIKVKGQISDFQGKEELKVERRSDVQIA